MLTKKTTIYRTALVLVLNLIGLATAAEATCRIFEHRDYKGAGYTLRNGDRMIMTDPPEVMTTTNGHDGERVIYEPSWNDALSSFKLTGGCAITIWKHAYPARDLLYQTTKSFLYVGDRKNDEASEVSCSCPQ